MRFARGPGCFIRKVFWLAALGFGVLFLSGPVVGIVSLVLGLFLGIASLLFPFVIIGLIVWLPIRALAKGKNPPTWSDVQERAGVLWRGSFVVPVRTANGICRGAVTRFYGAGDRIRSGAQSLGAFFVEVFCGAAVGTLFGLMASLEHPRQDYLIYAGSAGAVLGIGVGLSRFRAWRGEVVEGDGWRIASES
jgi:hypothetical protein